MGMELFSGYPAVFGGTTIVDTVQVEPSSGIQELAEMPAGAMNVQARAVMAQNPVTQVTCLNLGLLSTISPTNGLYLTSTCKLQYQKRAAAGIFDTTNHVTLVSHRGQLLPMSIRASQGEQQGAQFQLQFYHLWDGTNPIIEVIEQALAGVPQAFDKVYKLGPVYIAGAEFGGVQSSTINFGLDYQTSSEAGNLWPKMGAIMPPRKPTFAIEAKTLSLLRTYGFGMTRLDEDESVDVYFRKVGYAPDAAVHAKFSLLRPWIEIGNVPGNRADDTRPGFTVKPDEGAVITVDLASEIPS